MRILHELLDIVIIIIIIMPLQECRRFHEITPQIAVIIYSELMI